MATESPSLISGGGETTTVSGRLVRATSAVSGGGDTKTLSGRLRRGASGITDGGSILAIGHRVGYSYEFPTPVVMYATVTQVRLRIAARTQSKDSDTFTIKLVRRTDGTVLDTVVVPISSWERRSLVTVDVTRTDLLDGINGMIELPTGSVLRLNQLVLEAIGSNP